MSSYVYFGDRLAVLREHVATGSVRLIYTRPPETIDAQALAPLLDQLRRVLAPDGLLYLHTAAPAVYDQRLLLDDIFGGDSFLNEIIYTHSPVSSEEPAARWPTGHSNMLVYARDPQRYTINLNGIRIPYMAPDLVGPEKAARGKTPTDTWWHTRLPEAEMIDRVLRSSSSPGDLVLDCFANGGLTGERCLKLGEPRRFVLVEGDAAAMPALVARFAGADVGWVGYAPGMAVG